MADDLSSQLAQLRIDRGTRARAPKPWGLIIGIAAALGFGLVFYAVALPRISSQLFKSPVSFTEIASVSPAEASIVLTSAGYVVAQRVSHVAPKVPGRVSAIHVIQGQAVKTGDLLLELDATDEEANVASAQSRVKAAWARFESARANAETAKAELAELEQQAERERQLARQGVSASGIADDLAARVQSFKRRAAAAGTAVNAAEAEARALGADAKVLETQLRNLTLTAPISGTVVNKPPQMGEFVGPQPAGVAVDMGSVQIADFDSMLVETDVPEQRLHLVKAGAPAEIVLDAFPSRRYRGKTVEISPQVNRSKATVVVKVAFEDERTGVLPDMSARVSFLSKPLAAEASREPPKVVVPANAVVERAGAQMVFVVEEGRVRMVPIKLGPAFGSGFEVASGPAAGTRVVSDPPATLADGQQVKEKGSDE